MDTLLYAIIWIIPSVMLGVLIGHFWGRGPVLIRERKLAQEEREVTLKALIALIESTQQLTTDVDSHTSEIAAVGRSVGNMRADGDMKRVQSSILDKVTTIIEANHRLEDDLVVARYRMQAQAQELDRTRLEARTDALSGVANRKALDETLDFLLRNYKRHSTPFAMILCDVDHFKWINDTHGHTAGDRVVNQVGVFLKQCLRTGDYVARYGGDEFALLLPQAPPEVAQDIADRVRLEVECRNFDIGVGKERVAITFSVGVGSAQEGDTAESLIQRVDQALYKSKQSGRNQTHAVVEDGELLKIGA